MKSLAYCLILLLFVTGCSETAKERISERLLKLRVIGDHITVKGCAVAGEIDLLVTEVRPFLPDDPRIIAGEIVYDLNKPVAEAICAYAKKKLEINKDRLKERESLASTIPQYAYEELVHSRPY